MDKENKNQCLFCDAIFSHKGSLKTHEDSIHKNIKFDCQDCGKQYKEKGSLTKHINNFHRGIKYHCDQCDFKATRKINLMKHVKSKHETKMMLKENLTPLEALILRIDNNEKIPTDELISIVHQIVKS